MKKIKIFAIAAIVAAILLTGCEDRENDSSDNKELYGEDVLETVGNTYGASFCEIRDTKTGVHYFVSKPGGITVRLNADGTPYAD